MNKATENTAAKIAAKILHDPKVETQINDDLARSRLIDWLVMERCKHDMSQSDVAKKMGVSVSKVSRLEDAYDDDLRLGELKDYSAAIGVKMSMFLSDEKLPIADRVKHCVFRISEMLAHLTKLAGESSEDKSLHDAIVHFQGEVLFNFLRQYAQSGAASNVMALYGDKATDDASCEPSCTVEAGQNLVHA